MPLSLLSSAWLKLAFNQTSATSRTGRLSNKDPKAAQVNGEHVWGFGPDTSPSVNLSRCFAPCQQSVPSTAKQSVCRPPENQDRAVSWRCFKEQKRVQICSYAKVDSCCLQWLLVNHPTAWCNHSIAMHFSLCLLNLDSFSQQRHLQTCCSPPFLSSTHKSCNYTIKINFTSPMHYQMFFK